ncbi:MAG TPA: hypothetical protein VMI35_00075 [Puia sp.]|nr:hypothetical protein [Puia sp.]
MTRFLPHIVWTMVLSASGLHVFAQQDLYVKAGTDKDTILIGEPIHLLLEAKVPLGSSVRWFSADSLPHFDFVEKGAMDSVDETDGKLFRQHLVITSFDSGTHYIPRLEVLVNNQPQFSDSIRVEVAYSKFDPRQDYHDIKDILELTNPYVKYLPWSLLALTLLSVAGLIYFTSKERLPGAVIPAADETRLTPFEEAMRLLEELKKKDLLRSGQVKAYYTSLNDILRLFVLRKLQMASMEKTNDELILQLRQLPMDGAHFSQLAEALRMSDFVKFAKYRPDDVNNEKNFGVIEGSIRLLNEITS